MDFGLQKGFTPLHSAAKRGQVKTARKLIQISPKSVHSVSQNDLTPLHLATHFNHLVLVELLLDNDAQVNCRVS